MPRLNKKRITLSAESRPRSEEHHMPRTTSFSVCAQTVASVFGIISAVDAQTVPPPTALPMTGTCKLLGARSGTATYDYSLNLTHPSSCFWESSMISGIAQSVKSSCGRVTFSASGFDYTTVKPACTERLSFTATLTAPPDTVVTINVTVSVR